MKKTAVSFLATCRADCLARPAQPPAPAQARPAALPTTPSAFFYQQEVDSYKWPLARFTAFLAASMTDNFISDNTVTVTAPNQPPKVTPNTQSKASIAASNARGEYDMMQHATVALNITAIRKARPTASRRRSITRRRRAT